MIIIALTDIHGSLEYLESIAGPLREADVVLIAGDITNFGGRGRAKKILSAFGEYNNRILAVPGNCDRRPVEGYLSGEGINLDCNCVAVGDVTFVGLGGALKHRGHTPNESDEEEFKACLKEFESRIPKNTTSVLVTHHPAVNTKLDAVGTGAHAGSRSVRDFIISQQPVLALSGHFHEAIGIDRIGDTTLVNPGPFRLGHYAYIELDKKIQTLELRSVE